MSKVKPIFIIKVPKSLDLDINFVADITKDKISDYHIVVVPTNKEEFSFECCNGNISDIEIEELKKSINEH